MHADDAGPEVAERLRRAREAAYGPSGTPEGVRRLRELEAALEAEPVRVAEPEADAGPQQPAPRIRRRIALLVATALAAGGLAGGTAGFLAGAAQDPVPMPVPTATVAVTAAPHQTSERRFLQQRIVEGNGIWSADDYYRLYPSDLPPDWRADDQGRAYLQLVGATALPMRPKPGARALLIVTTCPSSDRRFVWVLRGADGGEISAADGRCGRLEGTSVPLQRGRGPYTLHVSISGSSGYSVAVFEQ